MSPQNGSAFHLEGTAPRLPAGQTSGKSQLPVTNPCTGQVDYQITLPTAEELTRLCDSLRAAQVKWAAAPLEHRVEVMLRWADELDKAYGPLSAADFTDTAAQPRAMTAPGRPAPLDLP